MECKIKNIFTNYEIIGEEKSIIMIHGYYPDHRLMAGCMEPVLSDKKNIYRLARYGKIRRCSIHYRKK